MDYTISVKNTGAVSALSDVTVVDEVPSGLTIDINSIKYYLGNSSGNAQLISNAGSGIKLAHDGNNLTFTIARLAADETISLIIPVTVTAYAGTKFENTAAVTEINGLDVSIESETTYHATGDPDGVSFVKVDADDNSKTLADTTFKLYKYTASNYSDAVEVTGFTKTTIDGSVYHIYAGSGTDTLTTESDGTLCITALEAGKYYLEEIDAPSGYRIDAKKHTFELSAGDGLIDLGKIENKYVAAGSITLEGTKSLTGKTLENNMFGFVVKDDSGNTVATAKNETDGTITFSDISFDCAGTHIYTVSEVDDGASGITYDSTVYTVTVTVADNGDGTLTSTAAYPSGGIVFNNDYTPEKINITVTKVWDDSDDKDGIRPDSVTVQLYANGEAYGDQVELNAANNWAYIWGSLPEYMPGGEGDLITFTVKEVDVPEGYTASYSEDTFTITNTRTTKSAAGDTTSTGNTTSKGSDSSGKGNSPFTGDDSIAHTYFITMLISGLGLVIALVFYGRKKKHSNR